MVPSPLMPASHFAGRHRRRVRDVPRWVWGDRILVQVALASIQPLAPQKHPQLLHSHPQHIPSADLLRLIQPGVHSNGALLLRVVLLLFKNGSDLPGSDTLHVPLLLQIVHSIGPLLT